MLIEFKRKSKWKLDEKKNLSIFAHFLVAVSLSNHAIERDMIHDIINALDDTISTSLHFISFDFIQVCYLFLMSNWTLCRIHLFVSAHVLSSKCTSQNER